MPNPPQSQAFYSNARRSSTFLSELSKNVNNSKGFLFLLPIKFRFKKKMLFYLRLWQQEPTALFLPVS
jgi:hypothetical protein